MRSIAPGFPSCYSPLERLGEAKRKLAKGDHVFWRKNPEHPPLDRLDPLARGMERLAFNPGHPQLAHAATACVR